ncbi:hypothetical protein KAZ82_01865 [Candidatus Babeliales bacterium]|nr:hypothetical protein [Candidatus Babeliales bacterium]
MKKIIFCSWCLVVGVYAGDQYSKKPKMARFISDVKEQNALTDSRKLEIERLIKDEFLQHKFFENYQAVENLTRRISEIVAMKYNLAVWQLDTLGYSAWIDQCQNKQLYPY